MSRSCLIGYSGFIGSNLARQHAFTDLYRSSNISEIEGKTYDLLVCAGVSAAKWRANQAPEQDLAAIDSLLSHLNRVRAAKTILISTVDVYPVTRGVDETFDCHSRPNHAYGRNRLYVEDAFKERYPETMIVRLPGVFGPGLKKNVIYDLLHDNCLEAVNPNGVFQYYGVGNLWNDLENIEKNRLSLVNLATEPLPTGVILRTFFPQANVGAKAQPSEPYDVRSLHAEALGGEGAYRFNATEVLAQLGSFIQDSRKGSEL